MIIALVAWLLHRANASPPVNDREQFYALKDQILRRYGQQVGEDLQHIVKPCWTGPCARCGLTGIWDEFYVRLERWQLGRSVFHRPIQRLSATFRPVTIEGTIRHPAYGALATECALWLALVFDRPLFWRILLHRPWSSGWSPYPLVLVEEILHALRGLWTRHGMRRCGACGRRFLGLGRPWAATRCRRCEHVWAVTQQRLADDIPF